MSQKQKSECFLKFLMEDDVAFYEKYLVLLSDEEREKFLEQNPEFMREYQIDEKQMQLMEEKMHRQILKEIQTNLEKDKFTGN